MNDSWCFKSIFQYIQHNRHPYLSRITHNNAALLLNIHAIARSDIQTFRRTKFKELNNKESPLMLVYFKTIRFISVPVVVAFISLKTITRFRFWKLFSINPKFIFTNVKEMTAPLLNINNKSAEQRCLKENLFHLMFTIIDGEPHMVVIVHHIGERGNVFFHIHSNALPCDEENDLGTVDRETMNRFYEGIRY